MERKIELILNNSELTAGTRGASLGPAAILTAARKLNVDFLSKLQVTSLPDFNYYIDKPTNTPFAKRIDGYIEVFKAIAKLTKEALKENTFPLILAGDHGSAAGTIAGIKGAFPDKRLGVIWIDAHGDLHSPYTTPSGNMHGMPLSLSLGEDNLQKKRNQLDKNTHDSWGELKNYDTGVGKFLAEDLVFVGVRDTEDEENAIMDRYSMTNHTVETLRREGALTIIQKIEKQLENCDHWYISFDVDSMDPEVTSYGTGTPVRNGIFPNEAKEILVLLAKNKKTSCIEIVEVNPCLDNKENTMAETAFTILEEIVKALSNK